MSAEELPGGRWEQRGMTRVWIPGPGDEQSATRSRFRALLAERYGPSPWWAKPEQPAAPPVDDELTTARRRAVLDQEARSDTRRAADAAHQRAAS